MRFDHNGSGIYEDSEAGRWRAKPRWGFGNGSQPPGTVANSATMGLTQASRNPRRIGTASVALQRLPARMKSSGEQTSIY